MKNSIINNIKLIFSSPFIILIRFYQLVVSPWLPNSCRFFPSCSQYGIESFKRFGLIRGLILTTWRILRCNPWGKSGNDPVPEKFLDIFRKKRNDKFN